MSGCVIWIQLNRVLKLSPGAREIAVGAEHTAQRGVRLSNCIIQFERCFHRFPGFWIAFLRRATSVLGLKNVRIGESSISQGILRVRNDRLVKVIDRLLKAIAGTLVPKVSPSEIKLVRRGVVGWTGRDRAFF